MPVVVNDHGKKFVVTKKSNFAWILEEFPSVRKVHVCGWRSSELRGEIRCSRTKLKKAQFVGKEICIVRVMGGWTVCFNATDVHAKDGKMLQLRNKMGLVLVASKADLKLHFVRHAAVAKEYVTEGPCNVYSEGKKMDGYIWKELIPHLRKRSDAAAFKKLAAKLGVVYRTWYAAEDWAKAEELWPKIASGELCKIGDKLGPLKPLEDIIESVLEEKKEIVECPILGRFRRSDFDFRPLLYEHDHAGCGLNRETWAWLAWMYQSNPENWINILAERLKHYGIEGHDLHGLASEVGHAV